MLRQFGLIGYPLSHSFSKAFFTEKFESEGIEDASYELFPMEDLSDVKQFIEKRTSLKGFNVTIPHKVEIIQYLDNLDIAARAIGAVNCVSIVVENNRPSLKGFNTDVIGFKNSLIPNLGPQHTHALVLGSGGASLAVTYVLRELKIPYKVVSRSAGDVHYNDVDKAMMESNKLIINTTPLGMYPKVTEMPNLPWHFLSEAHLVYDLVYNPLETALLKRAKAQGASVKNGLEMLELQAEAAWEIWNKRD